MQVCSNILFGFYPVLNSVGISTIVRTMANIRYNVETGKDFLELDEVCEMGDKFYIEQKLVGSQQEFKTTIEGFVECINLIAADLQIPSSGTSKKKPKDSS